MLDALAIRSVMARNVVASLEGDQTDSTPVAVTHVSEISGVDAYFGCVVPIQSIRVDMERRGGQSSDVIFGAGQFIEKRHPCVAAAGFGLSALPQGNAFLFSTGYGASAAAMMPADVESPIWGLCPSGITSFNLYPSPIPITALGKSLSLLAARKGLLSAEQYGALERQLTSLLADAEPEDISISIVSLNALITFLSTHRPQKLPNVSITKDGKFSTSWAPDKKSKLTLTFDTAGGAWVAIDLEQRQRTSGAFVLNSLDGISQPFRTWIGS